jgi:hypothetical protein
VSYAVQVDMTSLQALRERARKGLAVAAIRGAMLPPLRAAAATERATHRYRNRTGNLQRSTRAVTKAATRKEVRIALEMTMPYAYYVWRGGWSGLTPLANSAAENVFAGLVALLT